jgi:ATP synthase protein I
MTPEDRVTETRRAIERDAKRVEGTRSDGFLRALALVGSVGWPIALLTAGGAIVGRLLDQRYGSGVTVTLALLFLGAVTGFILAMRSVRMHGGGG